VSQLDALGVKYDNGQIELRLSNFFALLREMIFAQLRFTQRRKAELKARRKTS
jgi:hypothetical protein